MPDLLLEILSEEIPARMQAKAAEDLRRLVADGIIAAGLTYEGAKAFATPRRLALTMRGIPAASPARSEERKGPRVGAPEAAIQGFLKSAGLSDLSQAQIQSDPKKGEFYAARIETPGRPAIDILAELIPSVIRGFPWPKSMRWGAASASTASLRWVRPLRSILCTFGPETEEPDIVRFSVDGIAAGETTFGHRFLAPEAIRVRRFDDYVAALERAKVVLDPERRKDIIRADAKSLAIAHGLDLVEDESLLDEVAGLVEWPVVLMGSFDPAFLDVPAEVIRATIRANQKCFVFRDGQGRLANRFLLVANIEARDGGKAIVAGNERVVRARLSDAKYFWETDQKPLPDFATDANRDRPLDQRLAKLRGLNIVFHEKLGTQGARVDRIVELAKVIAPIVGGNKELAGRAAELAKADLVSEIVGEFPETQGLMGGRYAALQGEADEVATAIAEHYKPQGPADRVPTAPVSIAVALADKLDMLAGFWAIGETPTGSKDPFALRRAALGVIRIVLENGVRLKLGEVLTHAFARLPGAGATPPTQDLLAFLADRLKVQLREQGARHDLVDAVFALGGQDDLVLIVKRVEALGRFLATADGTALLAGYRRAANILRAEEKRDGVNFDETPLDLHLLEARGLPEEKVLAHVLDAAEHHARDHVVKEEFEAAMAELSASRPAIDAFFDKILVNDPDPALRKNRLALLARLRRATREVADFARIEGG